MKGLLFQYTISILLHVEKFVGDENPAQKFSDSFTFVHSTYPAFTLYIDPAREGYAYEFDKADTSEQLDQLEVASAYQFQVVAQFEV